MNKYIVSQHLYPAALLLTAFLAVNGCKRNDTAAPAPRPAIPDRVEVRPSSSGERVRVHKHDSDGNDTELDVDYIDGSRAVVSYGNDGSISEIAEWHSDGSCVRFIPGAGNTFAKASCFAKDGAVTTIIEHIGKTTVETQMEQGKAFLRKTDLGTDNRYEVLFFAADGVTPRARFVLTQSGITGGAVEMFFYDGQGKLNAVSHCEDEQTMSLSRYGTNGVELFRQHWRMKSSEGMELTEPPLALVEELTPDGSRVHLGIELPASDQSSEVHHGSRGGPPPVRLPKSALPDILEPRDTTGMIVHEYDSAGHEIATRTLGADRQVVHEIVRDAAGQTVRDRVFADGDQAAPVEPLDMSHLVEIETPSLDEFVPYLSSLEITQIPSHFQQLISEK